MTGRLYAPLLGVIIALGCVRIIATYGEFWQTWDEPAHIAAGLQWWEKGRITHERLHPPLARIAVAAGPYLAGVRGTPDAPDHWTDGNALLHQAGGYERNLALARMGILPFFTLASLVVAAWTSRCAGRAASLVAVFLFGLLPPVLAHSSLASLDMACAALVSAALYVFVLWLEKPDLPRAIVLGVACGLAVTSKFSAIAFLGIAGAAILCVWFFRRTSGTAQTHSLSRFASIFVAAFSAALSVWAVYRFSFGTLRQSGVGGNFEALSDGSNLSASAMRCLADAIPIPAIDFFWGLFDAFYFRHDEGHLAYFLGDIGQRGWWLFYPVLLLVKTPLAFILLAATGVFFVGRVRPTAMFSQSAALPLVSALAVIVAGIFFTPNNGLRQILAVYPPLAVVAGFGLAQLWSAAHRAVLSRAVVVLLVLSCAVSSFAAHPDYLAYFNFLAAGKPDAIVADSDLDWGQDLRRLSATCRRLGIRKLSLQYNGSKGMDVSLFDLPETIEFAAYERPHGWVAVSRQKLLLGTGVPPYDQFAWMRDEQPVEEVGRSIILFHFE